MNANELADELEEDVKWTVALNTSLPERLIQASFLLRQQQNEIEDLKNANRFIQNFAEEQHQRAVGLEAETEALKDKLHFKEFYEARPK